jgi:hypothetical protein
MTKRLTGKVINYSPTHKNGKVRIDGTELVLMFHSDEFKSKILSRVVIGQTISFSARKIRSNPNVLPTSTHLKAVNCVVEFEDDNFLTVEEISGMFPASPE